MNTPPSHTPEIKIIGTASVPDISVGADLAQERTKENTATVLDFTTHLLARQKANTPLPIILPRNIPTIKPGDALPESMATELPDLIGYIFSKVDNINDIDPVKMEDFRKIMHIAAEIDARAGRFGMIGIKDHSAAFSDTFKRALRPALRNLIPENEQLLRDINVNLGAIFNNTIQDKLLSAYGEIIKNQSSYESPEQFEERLEALKRFKNSWKAGGLDWAIPNENRKSKGGRNNFYIVEGSIPVRFEQVFTCILETFVEHYVRQVWEVEAAIRHVPAEIAKSA